MEHLPKEVLIDIAKYIRKGRFATKTLHSLTLCSRQMHTVFQPELYSHISPDWSIYWIRLIIHLWSHPELANQVRHLQAVWSTCGHGFWYEFDEEEFVGFIDYALDKIFEAEEKKLRSKWRKHLLLPCEEAWMGLLLVRLPHLHTIEFSYVDSKFVSDILRKAAQRQRPFHQTPPFPHLREVIVAVPEGHGSVDAEILTPFFYFPAVRNIQGGAVCECISDETDKMPLDIRH
ncbi:hypothetical protein N7457_003851 [Penicillium paradoxum]|uniref:uncharacterized protein n=1 Tax=Penicillium paradoxum TaxID=176176 RepID=UPI002547F464|nr:uncharacterized protein N7457_003851 [Penicillium paradoxum]KAJ5782077.1 hypothetical protein N7457_003851 [Penicillium paradoxum]